MKNYLEKLIKVVNEEDWNKLRTIDLKTSKLKDYLTILLDNRNHEFPINKELRTRLKIGDNLHRKMKSVLLLKCYDILAPKGGLQLLDLLSRYRLYENFTREVERQEKEIIKKKSNKEKSEFYHQVFQDYRRLPYSLADLGKLEDYSEKYLNTIDAGRVEEERISLGLRILTAKMLQYFFNLRKGNSGNEITKEINLFKKQVAQINSESLVVQLNFAFGFYYFYVDKDDEKAQTYFLRVKKLMTTHDKALLYDEQAAVNVFIGLIYYDSDKFKEAIQILQDTQKKYSSFLDTQTHVINRLIELHLIEGNIGEAKWLLDNSMRKFIDIEELDSAELASISYIKYYLLADDYDMAYNYLDKARRYLNKKFYLNHDIELRILEVMYFMFIQDYAFAKNLITRGIKFLHEKAKEKEVQSALEKYRLMQRLCKFTSKNKKIPPVFASEIRESFKGYQRLLGILLIKSCNIKAGTQAMGV